MKATMPIRLRCAPRSIISAVRPARGRRIAVLGDMLELGPDAPQMHAALVDDLVRNAIDQVYLSGPLMAHLWAVLPAGMGAMHVPASADLHGPLLRALQPGDVVTVKGSLGSKMGPIVKMLMAQYPLAQSKAAERPDHARIPR